MILRLDPAYPLVWRSPCSAQFGVDHPDVVLPNVSSAEERMISALVPGVPRSGVRLIGLEAGATEAEVGQLLQLLSPILLEFPAGQKPAAAKSPAIVLAGSGRTASTLAAILGELGLTVRVLGELDTPGRASSAGTRPDARANAGAGRPALSVVVGHFVLPPRYYGLWLSQDVPHLPVVFGDREVRIGPMVEPGTGPCLYCLHRNRLDTDPAWPAIASQLWGRRSALETVQVAAEVAALAARQVTTRLQHGASPVATALHLDAATGRVDERPCQPHPGCGCRGVERLLAG